MSEHLANSILLWLDDTLARVRTVKDLLDVLEDCFLLCAKYRLRLRPKKCDLHSLVVRWCGRLISKDGVKFDQRRLQGLLEMEERTYGAHLQQVLCALQCVKTAIPNFSSLINTLNEFMELVYTAAGQRRKRSVARIQLSLLNRGERETAAFESCKTALAHQVTLTHRDEKMRLCFYTDASDQFWSGIITQIPREDMGQHHSKQLQAPFAFLSGRFSDTQARVANSPG